jgi:predicted ATP-dependent endonuclease of OLD family
MKLSKITIADFRSILNQDVNFDQNCIGLIGLNESGKSNVLNAIRMLDSNYLPSHRDRSKISRHLPRVDCHFALEKPDYEKLDAIVAAYQKDMTYSSQLKMSVQYPKNFIQTVQVADKTGALVRESNIFVRVEVTAEGTLCKAKDINAIPEDVTMDNEEGTRLLKDAGLTEKALIPAGLHSLFDDYSLEAVAADLETRMGETLSAYVPQVIFWEFNDKYLLPSEIQYEVFLANDDPYNNSAPLFNMFLLSKALRIANAEDLKSKIAQWKSDSGERRKDGSIITRTINQYIKQIWSDYDQELKVELEENKITIHITDPNSADQNFYAMEARSQGFKTFISFILTIAADAANGIINNFILLLDEPETHLHPSGVRYMKEELLKLSESQNYIVYSTHSIFMIDRENLRRHILVSKKSEITELSRVTVNNFIQEAVIYESMGTRIDEFAIGNKNIVLEGDMDLLLLEFYMSLFGESEFIKDLHSSHLWNGGGTKRIGSFFKSKILPHKSTWLVILDNDSPGQQLVKTLVEEAKASPFKVNPVHYSNKANAELEDILPKDDIKSAFERTIEELNLPSPHSIDFAKDARVVSQITGGYQGTHSLTKEQNSLYEQTFKDRLFVLIKEALDQFRSIDDLEKRRSAFIARFPSYHESVGKIILKTPPKAES